jgi:hypothetical protein
MKDLQSDEKLRERIFTGANQQTHYQDLHEQNRKRLEEQERIIEELRRSDAERKAERLAIQQQQAAEQNQISPDQLKATYGESAKSMVEAGFMEEDFNDLYPVAAAGVLSMRDEFGGRIAQLEAAVGRVLSNIQHTTASTAQQTVQQQIDGIFSNLSAEGGIFEPLKDQETQRQFLTKISKTLNPEVKSLIENPNVLRDLWIAENHQKLVESAEARIQSQLSAERAKKDEEARRLAVGEGGGNRPGAQAPRDPSEAEVMAQETWGDL